MGDDGSTTARSASARSTISVGQGTDKGDGGGESALGVGDDYTRYLEAGSAGDFARKMGHREVPVVRKLLENPAYTDFWSLQAVDKWLAARPLTVPTMLVVGPVGPGGQLRRARPSIARSTKDKNNDRCPW